MGWDFEREHHSSTRLKHMHQLLGHDTNYSIILLWLNHAMKKKFCKFDLMTDLLVLMCYQNYRFPVKLPLGSLSCVFDFRLEQSQLEGKRESGKESKRSGIGSRKSHNPISLWSRLIQWMDGTELRASHPLHTLSLSIRTTDSHSSLSSPPVLTVLIQGRPGGYRD